MAYAKTLRDWQNDRQGSGIPPLAAREKKRPAGKSPPASLHLPRFYCFQAARTGCPISNAGSAPFRGMNFCGRPPHTSAV